MEIRYFMPLWGNEHVPLAEFFKKSKEAGYHGIEMNIPFDKHIEGLLKNLLVEFDLDLIAQQWLPPKTETADGYTARMEENLKYLASFQPLFINSHTGKDFYSFEDNCRILEVAGNNSKETGVGIYHETHRGRCLYSAPMAKLYFAKYPGIEINADFSHWCCVSESLLEEQDDVMKEAIKKARCIHARVGHSQGPQINHPFAPENNEALKIHVAWWQQIIDNQKKLGAEFFPVVTEFGPMPYMQSLPFTEQPVADLWNINLDMMNYLKSQFEV